MPFAPAASPQGPVTPARTIGSQITAVLAAVTAAGTLATCGSSRASTGTSAVEKPDLTVAVVPAAGAAGLYIAQQDGYFTAAGLHVKIVPVASGGDVLADLVNGSVDVDQGQWTSDIAAQAAGIVRLHALAAGNAGGPGVQEVTVPSGSPIRTIKRRPRSGIRTRPAGSAARRLASAVGAPVVGPPVVGGPAASGAAVRAGDGARRLASMAASTSCRVMRPSRPEPRIAVRSRPAFRASRLISGDATATRPPGGEALPSARLPAPAVPPPAVPGPAVPGPVVPGPAVLTSAVVAVAAGWGGDGGRGRRGAVPDEDVAAFFGPSRLFQHVRDGRAAGPRR